MAGVEVMRTQLRRLAYAPEIAAEMLRVDPDLHAALEMSAADELRSINAQIEFLLTRAVRESGRERRKQERKRDR